MIEGWDEVLDKVMETGIDLGNIFPDEAIFPSDTECCVTPDEVGILANVC